MTAHAPDITEWLRQQVNIAAARGLVVGLSGGLDSAVVARLCQLAMPDNVVGMIMPCHSDPRDEQDAGLLARRFDLPVVRLDLAPAFDHLVRDLKTILPQLPPNQAAGAPPTGGTA